MLSSIFVVLLGALPSLTADEIMTRHLAARGGNTRLEAIESVVYSRGKYREGAYESEKAFMAMARPYFKIVSNPDAPADFREGYDGSAWEWYADPGVVLRTTGAAHAALRHNLWPEGPFLDYAAKGTTIENLGTTSIDGGDAYRLRVTLQDGFVREYFIDAKTWLVVAERFAAPIHAYGQNVKTETRVGDYREADGVLFAHSYRETEIGTGRELSSMNWGSIEVNRKLPRSWFAPPQFERTPLQVFLEQLFNVRSDPVAIRWMYHEFHRAYPGVDTRDGVEFIGFQMGKMGDHAGAVTLLELNAKTFPRAASAAFALGRAHRDAGDRAKAKREFERALTLDPAHKRAKQEMKKFP